MATAEAAQRVLERSEASPRLDRPAGGDAYSAAVRALTDAMVRFDDVAFEEHLRRASYLGSSTLVFERVLVPILARVGELWREGHVSIAQEHFVSQSIATLVRDLTRIVARSDARDAAIVACFADEDHEIGALGVALRLSTWGVRPVFLGARTPPAAIRSAVESLDPALVALSVTVSPERARCRELLDGYGSACAPIPWIVGGQGVDAMADLVAHAGGTVGPAETKRLHAVVGQTLARSSSPRARP
jgi:methanogenic corrinoid protein MtbC1